VSFQSPAFLLALLLVPLAAGAYVRAEARRRRGAAAFATPATMPSVTPRRPGWRRHAPMAVYALAVAALAVALARPQATVAVPEERASVVLALDSSGSMDATDIPPSRLAAVRKAAGSFLDDVPDQLRVGAVVFNHKVRTIEGPSTDRDRLRGVLDRMRSRGGTATGDALAASLRMLERQARRGRSGRSGRGAPKRPPAAVILLSDGATTHGRDPLPLAREAGRLRIPVHTVALGTDSGTIEVPGPAGARERKPVPPDRDTLRRIAELSGGRAFGADAADELGSVYDELGSRVGKKKEKREVTAAFAGVAALCLAGGGMMSLRWFGRLP
jgi:Ca-activated chloride channel homolog